MAYIRQVIEDFVEKTLQSVHPISIDSLLAISNRECCLIEPLFAPSSSTSSDCAPRKPDNEEPLMQTSSSVQSPQILTNVKPSYVGFLYPSREEILSELPNQFVVNTGFPGNNQGSPKTQVGNLTQEFDDSFPTANLTQLMAVPHSGPDLKVDRNESEQLGRGDHRDTPMSSPDASKPVDASRSPPVCAKLHPCFMTAGGKELGPPSLEALERARSLLEGSEFLPEKPISTHDGPYALPTDCALADISGPQDTAESHVSKTPLNSPLGQMTGYTLSVNSRPPVHKNDELLTGFRTAKGGNIFIMDASSKERARILVDTSDSALRTEDCQLVSGQSPIVSSAQANQTPLASSSSVSADNHQIGSTLINTAISLPHGTFPSHNNTPGGPAQSPIKEMILTTDDSQKIQSERPCSMGFVTASGHQIKPLSLAALERAKKLCELDSNRDDGEHNVAPVDSFDQNNRQLDTMTDAFLKDDKLVQEDVFSKENKSATSEMPIISDEGCLTSSNNHPAFHSNSAFANDIDSFTGLLDDTEFPNSVQNPLEHPRLELTDPMLEAERQAARSIQQEFIAQRYSTAQAPPSRCKISSSGQNAQTGGKIGPLYCPGPLWCIRLAQRKALQSDRTSAACLKPIQDLIGNHHLGSLSLQRKVGEQKQFRLPPNTYFPPETSSWCLRTAAHIRWICDLQPTKEAGLAHEIPVVYETKEGFRFIPDDRGSVGKEELISCFLASRSISAQLVSRCWASHHYDQIVWKLGSTAIQLCDFETEDWDSSVLPDEYFSPRHVLLRLQYRYDRELEAVERSALRRIVEHDDTAARRLILCVSEIEVSKDKSIHARLSDGWYQIDWQLDAELTRLIRSGRIRVGSKLVTAGAELVEVGSPPVRDPPITSKSNSIEKDERYWHLVGWDGAAVGVALRLHGNSTRPAPWNALLGFAYAQPGSGCGLYPVPLCSLAPDGGICTCIRVVIQRRYSLQYMEAIETPDGSNTTSDGASRPSAPRRYVFRSERAEQAEVLAYDAQRRAALDRALHNLIPAVRSCRQKQLDAEQLAALGNDGEALFNAVMNAADPAEAEAMLTEIQREAIRQYKETQVRNATAELVPARKVTPLLRVRVAGLHPKDIAMGYVVPLTFWNPTDEMLSVIKEGQPVEIYRLQASTTRSLDPFAPPCPSPKSFPNAAKNIPHGCLLSLSGGRHAVIHPLVSSAKRTSSTPHSDIVDDNMIAQVYEPRHALSVADVHRLSSSQKFHTPNKNSAVSEIDLHCVVVTVLSSKLESTLRTHSDKREPDPDEISSRPMTPRTFPTQITNVDSVYVADLDGESHDQLAVIKVWDGLKSQHLTNLIQKGRTVNFTDLQLRRRSDSTNLPIRAPECASSSVSVVSLSYTVASNVSPDNIGQQKQRNQPFGCRTPSNTGPKNLQLLDQLEKLAKIHWSCVSTPSRMRSLRPFSDTSYNPAGLTLSALLQNAGETDTTSMSGPRIDPLTMSTSRFQSLKQCLTNQSPCKTPLIRVAKQQPATSVSTTTPLTKVSSGSRSSTPAALTERALPRTLPTRSAPRAGLSRLNKRSSAAVRCLTEPKQISGEQNPASAPNQQPVSKSTAMEIKPDKSDDPKKPPLFLLSDEVLSATPEPRVKRRRTLRRNSPKMSGKTGKEMEHTENDKAFQSFDLSFSEDRLTEDLQSLIRFVTRISTEQTTSENVAQVNSQWSHRVPTFCTDHHTPPSSPKEF
ncbi:unnamed protein product [Calicophoron daubneyi]|uniref:Breast cancer type 2 susceptibility protein n=1 Tax=Calicophoron daubneyi TaxID=300641 RepID=A0AAV2TFY3_CALDB